MQAPPSIAADVRKLSTVSATTAADGPGVKPLAISTPWSATAIRPAPAASPRIAVLAG